MGIGETLTTKAGPLPVWAWGVGGGVGLALLLRMRGAGGANPVGPVVLQPASAGGGLSVASGQPAPADQGTGSGSLVDRTVVRDPTSYSATQLWDTTNAGSTIRRFYNPNFPMFSAANRYGAGWDSQAQADAQGGAPSSPAPSPAQNPSAVVSAPQVPHLTPAMPWWYGPAGPVYQRSLDRLASLVGQSSWDRVNQWVGDAENIARQRGQLGAGNVNHDNLWDIALGGVLFGAEDRGLTDPAATGWDLSSYVSNTLNPGQAVDFLLAGGVPNRYALDNSRYSESGRPLTALMPVGV